MTRKDQATLWRRIVQDYEVIRAEQETVWQTLDLSETALVMEQLFLLLEEIEHGENDANTPPVHGSGSRRDAVLTQPA